MGALSRALYFLREAVSGLRSSPVTSAVAVGTIATTLLVTSVFGLVLKQMAGLLEHVGADLTVTAYLEQSLDDRATRDLATRVSSVESVSSVEVVTRDEALRRFESAAGDRSGLLDGLVENPLPASLEIALVPEARTREGIARLAAALDGLPGIAEVGHGEEWIGTYGRLFSALRWVAVGLGVVLSLAAFLIVANTIRLAVYARRDEVEILALVGASRSFIATPFLLEGVLQGTAGALLSVALLWVFFRAARVLLTGSLAVLIGHAEPVFFSAAEVGGVLLLGATLGLVGSLSAMASVGTTR